MDSFLLRQDGASESSTHHLKEPQPHRHMRWTVTTHSSEEEHEHSRDGPWPPHKRRAMTAPWLCQGQNQNYRGPFPHSPKSLLLFQLWYTVNTPWHGDREPATAWSSVRKTEKGFPSRGQKFQRRLEEEVHLSQNWRGLLSVGTSGVSRTLAEENSRS